METFEITVYVIGGLLIFLNIILFALVVNLYQKIKQLKNGDDDDDSVQIRPQQDSDYTNQKSEISKSWQQFPTPQHEESETNLHYDDPRNSENNDFSNINFNDRISPEKLRTQGGAFRNPLYGKAKDELESRFKFDNTRFNNSSSRPPVPQHNPGNFGRDFRQPATHHYNAPNNDYTFPKRNFNRNGQNYY